MARSIEYIKTITPTKIVYEAEVFYINRIHPKLIICKYRVEVDGRDRLIDLFLDETKHPNADPSTNLFCLPDYLRGIVIDDSKLKLVEVLLSTYNLNNCYWSPWRYIKYSKESNINRQKKQDGFDMKLIKRNGSKLIDELCKKLQSFEF